MIVSGGISVRNITSPNQLAGS
ncbi:hypothetical protein FOXYSP1_18938 [Fusarium oxysporum f. sp. phaseoli]